MFVINKAYQKTFQNITQRQMVHLQIFNIQIVYRQIIIFVVYRQVMQITGALEDENQLKATKSTHNPNQHQQQVCCRICLEQMAEEQVLDLCSCKGANAFVHQNCLLEWAKKSVKYTEFFQKYFYYCEICKDKIYLKVEKNFKCLSYRSVSFMGQDACCFKSSILIVILSLVLLAVSIGIYFSSQQDQTIKFLFYIAFSFSAFIIVLDVILTAIYYFLYAQISVIGIDTQPADIKSKNQVRPSRQRNIKEKKHNKSRYRNSQVQNLNITELCMMDKQSRTKNNINQISYIQSPDKRHNTDIQHQQSDQESLKKKSRKQQKLERLLKSPHQINEKQPRQSIVFQQEGCNRSIDQQAIDQQLNASDLKEQQSIGQQQTIKQLKNSRQSKLFYTFEGLRQSQNVLIQIISDDHGGQRYTKKGATVNKVGSFSQNKSKLNKQSVQQQQYAAQSSNRNESVNQVQFLAIDVPIIYEQATNRKGDSASIHMIQQMIEQVYVEKPKINFLSEKISPIQITSQQIEPNQQNNDDKNHQEGHKQRANNLQQENVYLQSN